MKSDTKINNPTPLKRIIFFVLTGLLPFLSFIVLEVILSIVDYGGDQSLFIEAGVPYENYLKTQWLEILDSQFSIPVQILNPMNNKKWRVIAEDPSFDPKNAHRFIEPFSNLF